jgi:hypothetical protein
VVGFEERSFILDAAGKYVYTNYERRRFYKIMSQRTKNNNHLPPGYSVEVKDGIRILHVGNKTFVLGLENPEYDKKKKDKKSDNSEQPMQKSEGYNIMLNSCFLHRAYLEMYFDPRMVPPSLVEYVDGQKNCEDILMSVVATKFLRDLGRPQCGVLAVKSGWVSNLEAEARKCILII